MTLGPRIITAPSPVDAGILQETAIRSGSLARESRYFVTEEFIRGAEAALEWSENPRGKDPEVLRKAIAIEILCQRGEVRTASS